MQIDLVVSLSPTLADLAERLLAVLGGAWASKPAVARLEPVPARNSVAAPSPARAAKAAGGGAVAGKKPHRVADKKAARKVTKGWRTASRKAKLPELWRAGVSPDEIKAQFDADGGPPVPSNKQLGIWAVTLGAKRPKDYPNPFPKAPAAPRRADAISVARASAIAPPVIRPPAITPPVKRPAPATNGKFDPLSVAARLRAEDDAAQIDCPISWSDALEWANRHRPNGFDRPRNLKDIQAIRAYHRLPPCRIIRPHGPQDPLPAAHLIEEVAA
jgi:hypothetical protein